MSVELHNAAWVGGTRAAAYYPPLICELFIGDDEVDDREAAWSVAEADLLASMRERAAALGANAVLGVELSLDPFSLRCDGVTGLRLRATGTPALLEPLF